MGYWDKSLESYQLYQLLDEKISRRLITHYLNTHEHIPNTRNPKLTKNRQFASRKIIKNPEHMNVLGDRI